MTDRIDYTAASSPAVKAAIAPVPDAPPDDNSFPEFVPACSVKCRECKFSVLAAGTVDGVGPECRP
jgi:hypothetical protein